MKTGPKRSGSVTPITINRRKKWTARVTWTNKAGKRQDWRKRFDSKREANDAVTDKLAELDRTGDQPVDADAVTLIQLGEHVKEKVLIPTIRNAKRVKIAGMNSWQDQRRKVDFLVERFGPQTVVNTITYAAIAEFFNARLLEPVVEARYVRNPKNGNRVSYRDKDGKKIFLKEKVTLRDRAVASVHRDIAALRKMFEAAKHNRWLTVNPLTEGPSLIRSGAENKREMIASPEQAEALLAAARESETAPHLYAILVCAFDTGCRPVEWKRLLVKDVDFKNKLVTFFSDKGLKTRSRTNAMTDRMLPELRRWCAGKKADEFVFAHTDGPFKGQPIKNVKRAFTTAKNLAALEGVSFDGFRFYDIRHTTVTRLLAAGMPIAVVGPNVGHTQSSTTDRYNHPDLAAQRWQAEIFNRLNSDPVDGGESVN